MSGRVLVVDDASFMRMMIRDILAKDDYEIHEAANGREAIDKFEELRPDLVMMDVTMPEVNGIEAIERIRELDGRARILVVSAMGQHQTIVDAIEAGALDFVVKPFQPTKVLETVRKCLQSPTV